MTAAAVFRVGGNAAFGLGARIDAVEDGRHRAGLLAGAERHGARHREHHDRSGTEFASSDYPGNRVPMYTSILVDA